jgi:hypothetical protein
MARNTVPAPAVEGASRETQMKTILTTCISTASALALAALAGCGSEESLAGSNPAPSTTTFTSTAPSFAELDAALELDSGDEAVVKRALETWTAASQSRSGEGKRPFGRMQEMEFVAAVAPSLDNGQLESLVDMMVERRSARREQMRERRGELTREKLDTRRGEHRRKHRGADAAGRMVEHRAAWLDAALQLSDDQESRVKAALTTMTQARKSIRTARKEDSITREQAHEQMRAAHDTLNEAMKTILTGEQEARLEILQPLFPGRANRT